MSYCDGHRESSYWKYVIVLPIMMIIQSTLLINTCIHYRDISKVPKQISISVFLIQIIGLSWFIYDFSKEALSPFVESPSLLKNNYSLCLIEGYGDKVFPFLFAGAVMLQLVLRLHITFKKSVHAMSKIESIALFSFFVFPFSIFLLLWLIFLDRPCIQYANPSDLNKIYYLCTTPWNNNIGSVSIAYIGISYVLFSNIFFGLLFSWKLNKVIQAIMNIHTDDHDIKNYTENKRLIGVQKVMIKNTILTISIGLTTLICYTMYFIDDRLDPFIYIDVFLNSLFATIMFKYNDYIYYKYICKVCNEYCLQRHTELELAKSQSNSANSNDQNISSIDTELNNSI